MSDTERTLAKELESLLVGTNDQRRRVGQALYYFYRSLLFWSDRGRGLLQVCRTFAAGGAAIFDTLAATLAELPEHGHDDRLRRFVASVLQELARSVERGDTMLLPYVRWLEAGFPELTQMMREEAADSRIHDFELARDLSRAFTLLAGCERADAVALLGETARSLTSRT